MNNLLVPTPNQSVVSRFTFFLVPLAIQARFSLPVLLLTLVFQLCGSSRPGSAQQPRAGSNWQNVQALPPGTKVDVKAKGQHLHCKINSVTDAELNCINGSGATPVLIERSDVLSVKIGHRTRSTLIGGAVGGGALALTGFAITTGGSSDGLFGKNFLRGQATAVGLGIGAVIGGGIGAFTDFSKSTIYKAP